MLENVGTTGYIGLSHGKIIPATAEIDANTRQALKIGSYVISEDQHTISIPIINRGQTIGMLRLSKPSHAEAWRPEEIADIGALSGQISNTLESLLFGLAPFVSGCFFLCLRPIIVVAVTPIKKAPGIKGRKGTRRLGRKNCSSNAMPAKPRHGTKN